MADSATTYNPGSQVKYDPTNPFNIGVVGTGNYSGPAMPKASEPTVLSTEQGVNDVNKANTTLATVSGAAQPVDTTYSKSPNESLDQYNARVEKYNASKVTSDSLKTGTAGATKPAGTVKFLNPDTNQTQTLNSNELTADIANSLKSQGYYSVESNGSVPAWFTTGNLELAQKEAQGAADRKSLDDLKTQLNNFTVTDAQLKAQTDAIGAMWDARIADMDKINTAQTASENTLGIRLGSQYAGGAMQSIVSEVERQGVQRIADLQAQKQQAITAAQDAARTQNWKIYSQQVDFAEKAYQASHDEVIALNKTIADNNKKIQDSLTQQNRDIAIAGLMNSGISDPSEIISGLKKNGIAATADDIAKAMANLTPDSKSILDVVTSAKNNGAPADILSAIAGSQTLNDAYTAAGKYGAAGTGIIGEYNYAKANGYTGTFSDYQTEDANRKKSATAPIIIGADGKSTYSQQAQDHAQQVLAGNETMQQVPSQWRDQVASLLSHQDGASYSPLAASRFTLAANRIVGNFIDLPQYKLTANGLPYLQRIDAAMQTPGSISDQDLLDSLTKLNTSGNAISDAQVRLITDGQSFADMASTFSNKFKNGGVLSSSQRQQIQQIAQSIYANYQKGYQPVYDKVTKQLKDAGIPEPFWTIPDLNNLSAQYENVNGIVADHKATIDKINSFVGQGGNNKTLYDSAVGMAPDATPEEIAKILGIQ